MTPAHRFRIFLACVFDGSSKSQKRLDFGRCSRIQVQHASYQSLAETK